MGSQNSNWIEMIHLGRNGERIGRINLHCVLGTITNDENNTDGKTITTLS